MSRIVLQEKWHTLSLSRLKIHYKYNGYKSLNYSLCTISNGRIIEYLRLILRLRETVNASRSGGIVPQQNIVVGCDPFSPCAFSHAKSDQSALTQGAGIEKTRKEKTARLSLVE